MEAQGIKPLKDKYGRPVPWGCWLNEDNEIVYPKGYFDDNVDFEFFDLEPEYDEKGNMVIHFPGL